MDHEFKQGVRHQEDNRTAQEPVEIVGMGLLCLVLLLSELIAQEVTCPHLSCKLLTSDILGLTSIVSVVTRCLKRSSVRLIIVVLGLALCAVHSSAAGLNVPAAGLIASYELNGGAVDSSGRGKHGTVFGALASKDRHGNEQGAMRFGDRNDYVTLPNDLLLSDSGSIAFWFKAESQITGQTGSGSYSPFNSSDASTDRMIHIALGDFTYVVDGEIFGVILGQNPNPRSAIAAVSLGMIPSGWHHVALVSDSTGHKFYFNGEQVTPTLFHADVSSSMNFWPLAAAVIRLGGSESSDAIDKPYQLDDVLIYDRALSASEVGNLSGRLQATIRISQVEICWNSVPGRKYQVEYREVLSDVEWLPLGGAVLASGVSSCVSDSVLVGHPARYYRVQELLDP